MTAAGPWSVKGIDPKAREIAKDLARRQGMTLGEWLNQMIIDGGEPEGGATPPIAAPPEPRRPLDELYREAQASRRPVSSLRPGEEADAGRLGRALEHLSIRLEAAEQRSVLAISGIDQSVMGVLSRLDEIEHEQGSAARLEGSLEEIRAAQGRVAERLRRVEGEDGPRAEGLRALEAALGRMALRLDEEAARAEAARQAAAAEAEGVHHAADQAREAAEAATRRLDRMETVLEAAPAAYADAEKVETVLTRMAERLDETQARTTAAVQSLQTSFAGLDARLRAGEARGAGAGGAEMERRFQHLAQELSHRVDASRTELAQRIRAATDGRSDGIEQRLRELGGHVEQAEKRSAQAIDRIGREVLRVAHSLGERMSAAEGRVADLADTTRVRLDAVETRSTTAVEVMSGEVSRLADVMETRLKGADSAQAEALEKLGGEIARIAERLTERISTSDRRSAEAIDEVTDKVSRIGAHIDERQAASASELSDRIRASEERTARLLEEARERLDQRLAESRRPALERPPEPVTAPEPAPAPVLSNADPFAPPPQFAPSEPPTAAAVAEEDPFARRAAFETASPFNPDDDFAPAHWTAPPAEPAAAAAGHEPLFGPAAFEDAPPAPGAGPAGPQAEDAPFLGFSVGDFAPPPEPSLRPEQLSTREMLEAARLAARRAAGGGREAGPPGSVPAPPLEPIGQAAAPLKPFGITFPGRRKKEAAGGPTLRTIALASVTAGGLTAMAVGAYLMGGAGHDGGKTSPEVAGLEPPPTAAPLGVAPAPAVASATPNLAVALTPAAAAPRAVPSARAPVEPKAKTKADPTTTAATTPRTSPQALYAAAVGRLNNGDTSAVADIRSAADQGVPAAQFYLARLYEAGGAGLKKDLTEARRWTSRAAESGDPSAMYNLASYLYAGDGGAKDAAGAANWFHRSATHGVVNGQYNLAQLYEKGVGVPQSATEAYKWYLVAAGSGDTEARSAADALKARLAPAAQAVAEKDAAQLHASLTGVEPVKTAAAQP